jgi:hypothetical protein
MTVNEMIDYLIEYQKLVPDGGNHEVKAWCYNHGLYDEFSALRVNDSDDLAPFCELCFTSL